MREKYFIFIYCLLPMFSIADDDRHQNGPLLQDVVRRTAHPSFKPTSHPTHTPSVHPTPTPSQSPSFERSSLPSLQPSLYPSFAPDLCQIQTSNELVLTSTAERVIQYKYQMEFYNSYNPENIGRELSRFIGESLIKVINPECNKRRINEIQRALQIEQIESFVGVSDNMNAQLMSDLEDVCNDVNTAIAECKLQGELSLIIKETNNDNFQADNITSSVLTYIKVQMNDGEFNDAHIGIVSLLYIDEDTETPVGLTRNDSGTESGDVPVYSWVLIGSTSALLAALISLWKLRKKKDEELLSEDEDSYSNPSGEWSSNYNSHLYQYDESESTPKTRNHKVNVVEQIA